MLKESKKKPPPTPEQIALGKRVNEAILSLGRGGKNEIAAACKITPQSVTGWCKTGRISTDSLLIVEKKTGYNLTWLLTGNGEKIVNKNECIEELTNIDISALLPVASPETQDILKILEQGLAENTLSPQDIQLLETIAKRLINNDKSRQNSKHN